MSFLVASRAGSSNILASFSRPKATSQCHVLQAVAGLHSSSIQRAESAKSRTARLIRKSNVERKEVRQRKAQEDRPHVVLGTRPGDDTTWRNCDLAKILVSQEALSQSKPTNLAREGGTVDVPQYLSYGLDGLGEAREKNVKFFFEHLPDATLEDLTPDAITRNLTHAKGEVESLPTSDRKELQDLRKLELEKSSQLSRVIDLRNSNARGIAFENRRRVVAAFSPSKEEPSSGYPEVQVALLTAKIRNAWDHLIRCKKDLTSRRALRRLVHQRAKMLKYIKRVDRDRYDRILERVALDPDSVEGELVI